MKKICKQVLAALCLWVMTLPSAAQGNNFPFVKQFEYDFFNHFGIGASVGLDGIGFDVAAPMGGNFALRAGITYMPKISIKGTFDLNDSDPDITDEVDAKLTLDALDFKLLADLYPLKSGSFHFTIGAFFGSDKFAKATNTSMFIKDPAKYGKLGLSIGDYRVTTDEHGYAHADAVVNNFKPYIGIGFGRAVPKSRLGFSCDFGLKFWGKPQLGAETLDDFGDRTYHKFEYTELSDDDDKDLKKGLKYASKVFAYPVITFRLSGRIL